MKKIINGKLYNTDTAKELATYESGAVSDNSHYIEMLYRKRTGEYFLYGEGGPASRYAEQAYGDNAFTSGEGIVPLTLNGAEKWAEKNLEADEYESIFGAVGEGSQKDIHIQIDGKLGQKLEAKVAESGLSQKDIITQALEKYL